MYRECSCPTCAGDPEHAGDYMCEHQENKELRAEIERLRLALHKITARQMCKNCWSGSDICTCNGPNPEWTADIDKAHIIAREALGGE